MRQVRARRNNLNKDEAEGEVQYLPTAFSDMISFLN